MSLKDKVLEAASHYSLRPDEEALFNECWELSKRVGPGWSLFPAGRVGPSDEEIEASRAFDHFDAVLRRGYVMRLGHRYTTRRPTAGQKYIVFSDHHWTHGNHRQNFFATSQNRELYIEVLEQYFSAGWTLVENGDVEELVIFEPTIEPTIDEIRAWQEMPWEELNQRRLETRRNQLMRILKDPRNLDLYRTVARFHDRDRYVRIAGNHDYDLQKDELLDDLRTMFRNIEPPYDYLLLETEARVDWVIMHGHQFDQHTNPAMAYRVGEILSESMGWMFEGADRVWRWSDEVSQWAVGRRPFGNTLSTAGYGAHHGGAFDRLGALMGNLHNRDAWEALFGANIAWEYFEQGDAQNAIDLEVMTGDEFFKFRHLDETVVVSQIGPRKPQPKLVLGHSHEPRFLPTHPSSGNQVAYYFNTGSAGRYENLIWGLEIANGEPHLVGWTRRDGPGDSAPERFVFTSAANTLAANPNPVPLWAAW